MLIGCLVIFLKKLGVQRNELQNQMSTVLFSCLISEPTLAFPQETRNYLRLLPQFAACLILKLSHQKALNVTKALTQRFNLRQV